MNLQNLFTEKDFELLNKAVDAFPKTGFMGMMMMEMLLTGIGKEEDKEKRESERQERMKSQEEKNALMEERCLELKFKLLQLKKMVLNDTGKEN